MNIKKLLTVKWKRILPLVAIILLLVIVSIPQAVPQVMQTNILRSVSAAGITDYTLTGTNDNLIFQVALDDLPATGGTLQVTSTGTIDWANGVTVTRAIDNVVIQGAGIGTLFDGDGVTAIFTAGGDYWAFRDFATDAGGLATGATINWSMTNILIDTDYYAYRGSLFDGESGVFSDVNTITLEAPTGRGATLVVAASDASALSKAQADYVCDGTADNVEIQAAIDALPAVGGCVYLTEGTYVLIARVVINIDNVSLVGSGWDTELMTDTLLEGTDHGLVYWAAGVSNILIRDMKVNANAKARYALGSEELAGAAYNITIENVYALDGTDDTISIGTTEGFHIVNNLIERSAGKKVAAYFSVIEIESDSCDGIISHNIIDGGMALAGGEMLVGVALHPAMGHDISDIIISNNIIQTVSSGVIIEYSDNVVITNNIITDKYTMADVGIQVETSTHSSIESNIIDLAAGSAAVGIRLKSSGTNVTGNMIKTVDNSYGNAIYSTDAITAITITDNTIIDSRRGIEVGSISDSVIANNTITGAYYSGITVGTRNIVSGNLIDGGDLNGIDGIDDGCIIVDNTVINCIYAGVILNAKTDVVIQGNSFSSNGYGVRLQGALARVIVINNLVFNNTATIRVDEASGDFTVEKNQGYIAPGEIRTASGSLTAGNANAIGFAWNNPEVQDILIKKVVIEVTTAGGTVGSHLDVGIADDAAGTNRGVEFFDDLLLNTTQVHDSWVGGDGGTQTKYVLCQDTASATDDWIVGQILDANAASLVGKYYIEYVGR